MQLPTGAVMHVCCCEGWFRSVFFFFRLRIAGLKGLEGVVKKTVSDDLQVNIWSHEHMNKIVPSLLYNMEESRLENPYSVAH